MTIDIEKHAEAILRAAGVRMDDLRYRGDKENILTACTALGDAMALAMREAASEKLDECCEPCSQCHANVATIDPATLRGVSRD